MAHGRALFGITAELIASSPATQTIERKEKCVVVALRLFKWKIDFKKNKNRSAFSSQLNQIEKSLKGREAAALAYTTFQPAAEKKIQRH